MKNILLLTSTIRPYSNQPQLKLTNPEERLEDYRKALTFYSAALDAGTIDGVVFVDNSGYDLKCLSENFPSMKIEWLSFYGLDYPSSYHRGYGEFKLIDYAFSNSPTLKGLSQEDAIWKVTGRYIVKNLRSVIRYAPKRFDLYCHIDKNWVDMGIMGWSLAGYSHYIKDVSEYFKTGMAPELILAERIKEYSQSNDNVITVHYWAPFIVGRRGGDGGHFQGKFTYFKFLIISSLNALKLPFRSLF